MNTLQSSVTAVVALLLLLVAAAWHSFLLFHSIVEFTSIAVLVAMFGVAWNSRRFTTNGYLTFLGVALLPVAFLDMFHTLSYQGMGVFATRGANQATQFWVAARLLEAAVLLLSPLFLSRRVRAWPTLLVSMAVAAALAVSILPLHVFPTAYVDAGPARGLTPFKIATEYAVSVALLAGGAWLWAERARLAAPTFNLVVAALVTKILSELAFTQYVNVYGDFNTLGHILKAGASLLMFKAIVEGSLRHPYQVLFRDLKQHEETLRASELRYRSLVEVSPDALVVSRDGRVEYANPAAVELFGAASPDQIVGRSPFDLFGEDSREKVREARAVVMQGQPVPLTEARLARLDGSVRDVEVVAAPFDDEQGRAVQVVLRDITEQKRNREELGNYARRLEEASRMKDQFLATLSHELRTPLNAILGWSEILLQGRTDAGQTRRALEVIARNARAQTALIADVLDVSRITSGRLRLNLRETDPVDSLRAALDTVRPAAEARRIQVVEGVMDRARMQGDPDRLQQVFWNLLSNAVKFTPEGGRIYVSASRHDAGHVQLEVRDTGEGLEPEALDHLFERFWQADPSTSRRHGGLGLGLAIVRHLVELHGGQIRAESQGPGRGSTFAVTLPVQASAAPPAPVEGGRGQELGPLRESEDLDGLKVLVVDDDADAREMAGAVLRSFGAEVFVASGSAEGLRMVVELRPDVVAADIGMPGEDGYDFVRKLRALSPGLGGLTPAIALTAYSRVEDRRKALAAGFHEHLSKPVVPHVLASTVARVARVSSSPGSGSDAAAGR